MRAPPPKKLLDLCDAGEASTPMERAVLLLRAAFDGDTTVEQWTLGQVNARLLELRSLLFGRDLECLANCPRCDAVAATQIDVAEMASASLSPDAPASAGELALGDSRIAVRLPTASDLIASGRAAHANGSRLVAQLLDRAALDDGHAADAAADLVDAVARHVARADPLAHIELVVSCPACAHLWTVPFYVIDILWTEICALAQRLIHEVSQLAYAFGWREAEILRMSARRRQRYLEALSA